MSLFVLVAIKEVEKLEETKRCMFCVTPCITFAYIPHQTADISNIYIGLFYTLYYTFQNYLWKWIILLDLALKLLYLCS